MAQIFHPRSGLYAKLTMLALLVVVVGLVAAWRALTAEPHGEHEAVEQPVPFSHQHHVGEVGLDCRYCHATVETRASAGMPSISTCMTCHSQLFTNQPVLAPLSESARTGIPLRWMRVHDLPGFVYFDHSIHVAKGVGCFSCHGRVDRMPLTRRVASLSMRWCLDCHRHPERFVRPHDEVFAMDDRQPGDDERLGMALVDAYRIDRRRLTDCSVCHR
ncbi:cytochrome c3 family protein [Luteibacter sp. 329MFSha]|uniref:cytochrome c3 family protein n=1 Tax=Luteibacter sp. 329MFSha TaxID=1798239 RepID=UPI0008B2A395|nr:cytochrome c3 family protein [Luteibacter sp. 329MFSha]SEV85019.1 Class III cytochrome C family protein [Luteibacter sp. 329MFSha]